MAVVTRLPCRSTWPISESGTPARTMSHAAVISPELCKGPGSRPFCRVRHVRYVRHEGLKATPDGSEVAGIISVRGSCPGSRDAGPLGSERPRPGPDHPSNID